MRCRLWLLWKKRPIDKLDFLEVDHALAYLKKIAYEYENLERIEIHLGDFLTTASRS